MLSLILAVFTACGPEPADLVLVDARAYTLRWGDPAVDGTPSPDAPYSADQGWRPDAQAVAVRGGRIVFVGTTPEARRFVGPDTEVLELGGATLLPGLVDSHTHVAELGALLSRVNLVGVETEEAAVALAAQRASQVPEGTWIIGAGWDEGAWADRYPDLELLSERVPNHPVYLRGLHGFAGWANRMALESAGIDESTEAPVGGEILRDPQGRPTGLVLNRAIELLDDAIPAPSPEQLQDQITAGLDEMARSGFVAVHDAGVPAESMEALTALEAENRLPIRVYAMLSGRDTALLGRWEKAGPDTDAESMLRTRSVKAYYDGALGSRGARLLEDYADQPGHRGVSGEGYGFDQRWAQRMMAAGFQVGIHAIGDAGNRETLDFIASVYRDAPTARTNRNRIEHAQVVHPDDFARFAELELIASMEPPHAVEDKAWAEDRLGPRRMVGAYAWRSMREAGVPLIFNSDLPGSDWSFFYGMHAAITRRDKALEPSSGWYPEQSMTAEEAVRAYSRWAAHAAFVEGQAGVIEPGRWADLTVISVDPFVLGSDDPAALLQGEVLATIVDGRIVYRRRD